MRIPTKLIAVLGVVLCPAISATMAPAAPAKPANLKAAYGALARLPDWSGVWSPTGPRKFGNFVIGPPPPLPPAPDYTPAGRKIADEFSAGQAEGKNLQSKIANCTPPGMPSIMRMPYPIEFLFTPGRVTIIAETYTQVRRIFTDGRPLPADPDPTFNGSSVGHWEGNTLVVDTIALNPKNELTRTGIDATENTKIHERFHMDKPGVLTVETTITEPAYFKTPYRTKTNFVREKGWEMREYVCEENNHDASDPFGRPIMDLKQQE